MSSSVVLVDSHCHLDDERFANEPLADVLARAEAAGVRYVQTIGTTLADFELIQPLAAQNERVFCSFGIHPHHAETDVVSVEDVVRLASLPKVIGIGETGLDYFYDNADRAVQKRSFRVHLEAARRFGLPVIVHTREAEADTMEILGEALAWPDCPPIVLHCFSSSIELAQWAIARGVYLSASGIITFKNAEAVREAFRLASLELLLVETDAPYLAPIPHRGQRNEPAYTRVVAEALAELKGVPLEELAAVTTENFFRVFAKAEQN